MTIASLAGIVRTHAAERPGQVALITADRSFTFRDLDERSSRAAAGLAAEGVGAQDRVAFLDKNTIEYFDVLFGGGKLNAVNVAVNWRLAPREVAYIVNDAQAKVLVVGQELVGVLDAIRDELTSVTKVLVVGEHPEHESYDAWLARQSPRQASVDSAAEDVCMQLYTSGTTGIPKGVMLTNANLFALMAELAAALELGPESVSLVVMPLFHIAGSGWAVMGLYVGCRSVLLRDVDPAAIIRLIGEHRVTHSVIVPAVLQFMLIMPGVNEADYSSLHTIVYGASPISVEVLTSCIRTFKCRFAQAYGMTETTGAVVLLPPEDHDPDGPNAHRLRAAGVPMKGVELRIADPATGEDVPTGDVGEIWVRTGQNMKGYWGKPEETAATIREDGWLRTGDAGYLDADGYLYIHDRVKDMIVSGGENIYPTEIENVLMSHPAVADVAVVGVPHEKWGETPKALVVRKPDTEVSQDELIEFSKANLARYKCPTSVEWIEAIPRNPSGKILKKDLREPYWAGRERRVN